MDEKTVSNRCSKAGSMGHVHQVVLRANGDVEMEYLLSFLKMTPNSLLKYCICASL